MQDASTPRRSHFLVALRGFAASYVVLHHAACTIYAPGITPPVTFADRAFVLFFQGGSTAVALFIAISGFSLMLPIVRGGVFPGATGFYLRRFWRVAPPYYVGLAVSALLATTLISTKTGTHWDRFIPFSPQDILEHVLFLHNFGEGVLKINGAYWSIAAEAQIYLFFPALALLHRRLSPHEAICAILCFGFACLLVNDAHPGLLPNGFLYIYFAIGVCGAILAHANSRAAVFIKDGIPLHLICMMTLIVGFALRISEEDYYLRNDGLVVCSFVGWMVLDEYVGTRGGAGIRFFSTSIFSKTGVFAYSTYLIHEPAQQLLWQFCILPLGLGKPMQFVLLAAASLTIVIAASYGFFCLVERNFLSQRSFEKAAAGLASLFRSQKPQNI